MVFLLFLQKSIYWLHMEPNLIPHIWEFIRKPNPRFLITRLISPRFLSSDGFFSPTCWSRGTSDSSTYGKQRICRRNSASTHFHVSWLSDFIFYPKPLYIYFGAFVTWLRENYDHRNVSWEMICIYMILPCPKWEQGGERNACPFRSPWVTLPLNLFFPTHFVLFPSALIWFDVICMLFTYANNLVHCIKYGSSHHAMRCCHHSVSIARSRL